MACTVAGLGSRSIRYAFEVIAKGCSGMVHAVLPWCSFRSTYANGPFPWPPAGKTTLMDVLSGRRHGPSSVSGEIRINGHLVNAAQLRKVRIWCRGCCHVSVPYETLIDATYAACGRNAYTHRPDVASV